VFSVAVVVSASVRSGPVAEGFVVAGALGVSFVVGGLGPIELGSVVGLSVAAGALHVVCVAAGLGSDGFQLG
jgi:hypothetical protein